MHVGYGGPLMSGYPGAAHTKRDKEHDRSGAGSSS